MIFLSWRMQCFTTWHSSSSIWATTASSNAPWNSSWNHLLITPASQSWELPAISSTMSSLSTWPYCLSKTRYCTPLIYQTILLGRMELNIFFRACFNTTNQSSHSVTSSSMTTWVLEIGRSWSRHWTWTYRTTSERWSSWTRSKKARRRILKRVTSVSRIRCLKLRRQRCLRTRKLPSRSN